MLKNKLEKNVKILWLNWGGEYLNQLFQDYLKDNEILS
jgi:hypothetical protein